MNMELSEIVMGQGTSSSLSFLQSNCLFRHCLSRLMFTFHFLLAVLSSGLKQVEQRAMRTWSTHVCSLVLSYKAQYPYSSLETAPSFGMWLGDMQPPHCCACRGLPGRAADPGVTQLRGIMPWQWVCCLQVLLSTLPLIPAPCCWKEDN